MNTHKVEAETVNVILIDPIAHRLYHKSAHHLAIRSRFIAATAAIGIASILSETVEISWGCKIERIPVSVESMVINHIHNDPDSVFVKRLHHLLELPYPTARIKRISTERALRDVVVLRIVTPAIFVKFKMFFINGTEIIGWHNMNMINSKLDKMINSSALSVCAECILFCQCHKLATIDNAAKAIDGKIPVLKFVEHHI